MAHPNSVLNIAIANYRQDFFDKLAAMEAHTYDNSILGGVAEYQPFWQAYSDAIMIYLGQSMGSAQSKDFIIGLYAYLSQWELRGRGSQAVIDASNALAIFDINGLVGDVLSRTVDYYDDFVAGEEGAGEDPGKPDSAARIEADTSRAEGAWGPDSAQVDALQNTYISALTDGAIIDIFAKPAPAVVGNWDGLIAWDFVFDTLGWQWGAQQGFLTSTLPERPNV